MRRFAVLLAAVVVLAMLLSSPVYAACPARTELITYNPSGFLRLSSAAGREVNPCADYWFFIPALEGQKTVPRSGTSLADLRARGARFHALAEFHWGAWSARPGTWFQKGVAFRRRMDAAGYNALDSWALQEMPSTTRSDPRVRRAVRDAVRGLMTAGTPSVADDRRGLVFMYEMGHGTRNFATYKPLLKSWLSEEPFWLDMERYVRWFAQETYTSCREVCVRGATVAAKARRIDAFTRHPVNLANAPDRPPGATGAARRFFSQSYVPLMTASWRTPKYGNTVYDLSTMLRLVSLQAYTARLNSARMLAFVWRDSPAADPKNGRQAATDPELARIATRLVRAFNGAYGEQPTATAACSTRPDGGADPLGWCQPNLGGAAFNEGWFTFSRWD